jgi:hypothetical protein
MNKKKLFTVGIIGLLTVNCEKPSEFPRQITQGPVNHSLDNNLNFSPDSKWLAYDTRVNDGLGIGATRQIARVNVSSGKTEIIYEAPDFVVDQGPGVGAVSYFQKSPQVVFIHGPFSPTGLTYAKTCRFGALRPDNGSGKLTVTDARDVLPPFTPGALRGGSHRHEPGGPDEQWLGYTYNDQIMKNYGEALGQNLDLRTIGVTRLGQPVAVANENHAGCWSGAGFSVLVVKVVPNPQPGTDEIFHADGDGWVGEKGYLRPDGNWQLARAFIGRLANNHPELFVVDIPADISIPGADGPLEGTETTFPMPPKGTVQRRLTFTDSGCVGVVRSNPTGTLLCYRSQDVQRKPQLFLISPLGGKPIQLTTEIQGVQSEGRWNPSGKRIYYAANNQIKVIESQPETEKFGFAQALTAPLAQTPGSVVIAPNGKILAYNLTIDGFLQIFVLTIPEALQD